MKSSFKLLQLINKFLILSVISIPIFSNFYQYINTTEVKSEEIILSFFNFVIYIYIFMSFFSPLQSRVFQCENSYIYIFQCENSYIYIFQCENSYIYIYFYYIYIYIWYMVLHMCASIWESDNNAQYLLNS